MKTKQVTLRWLVPLLVGAILVDGGDGRSLLRAQDDESSSAQAEVVDATEAARELGGKAADVGHHGLKIGIRSGGGELVKIGSDAVVKAGDKAQEVVVVFGDAKIEGEVEGDVVVVFGHADVNAPVRGEFVTVMGSAKLGPNAKLDSDCVVVGGTLERDPAAQLANEPVEVNFGGLFPSLRWLGDWFKHGFMLGRPLPPGVAWAWWIVGIHALIYLLIALLLPRPVESCRKTLDTQLVPAFFVGLLGAVLYVLLVFLLIATGIGVVLLPVLWITVVAIRFVGKTALFGYLGDQVFRLGGGTVGSRPLLSCLVGLALVTLMYMVPILGFIAWIVFRMLGFGAALMATFAAFRRNGGGPTRSAAAAPIGPGGSSSGLASPATPGAPMPSEGSGPTPADQLPAVPAVPDRDAAGFSSAEYALMPRAGFWVRFGAALLDFILLCWLIPTTGPFFIPAWIAYHAAMWSWKGTTIGGIVCGLKLIRADGRAVDVSVAIVRSLAAVFSLIALGLGFFWAGWTKERQSWHDKIAGTVIVRVPRGVSLV